MLGEVPRALLDKIIAGVPDANSNVTELSPEINKEQELFSKIKKTIKPYMDEEDGESELCPLIISIGGERIKLELTQDEEDLNGYVLKAEVSPQVAGGDTTELNIFIKEDGTNWGKEKASPEQVEISMKLFSVLMKNMPPPLGPWERKRIRDEIKLGIPFMIREQELERWRNDPYD